MNKLLKPLAVPVMAMAVSILALTMSLPGCSSMGEIDTLNKRILVAESTYSVVMDKVRVYVGEDRFSKEQLQRILPKVMEIRRALQSLQAAKELKDEVMAGNQVNTINRILQTFRDYLAQADGQAALERDTSGEYKVLRASVNRNVWEALYAAEVLL